MSHSSRLSYGVLDPGTKIFKGYNERKVLNPATPLANMIEQLAGLPLVFHPGTSWEYSVSTDVLSRLVEILSGQALDAFINERRRLPAARDPPFGRGWSGVHPAGHGGPAAQPDSGRPGAAEARNDRGDDDESTR
jgi:hypothetical protein